MDDYGALVDLAVKIVFAIGSIAGGIALVRQKRSESDTASAVEDAKQASARVYVDGLADSRKALVEQAAGYEERLKAEHARADAAAAAADLREADLREINEALRSQFQRSFDELARKVTAANESASDWHAAAIEAQNKAAAEAARADGLLLDMRMQRLDADWAQHVWRRRYGDLFERYRILVNDKFGDGTMTAIAGEAGSLVDESTLPLPSRPKDFQ